MGLDDSTRKGLFISTLIAIVLAFAIVGGSFLGTILFFTNEELLPEAPGTGSIFYTIGEPIETRFSSYEPLSIDVTSQLKPYKFDLSRAINRNAFDFAAREKNLLEKNGFIVVPTEFGQFFDLYETNWQNNIPNFVTTDSILHSFHILYDYLLRDVETSNFTYDLTALVDLMISWHSGANSSLVSENTRLETAIRKNIAYFSVAKKLLDAEASTPADVQELVDAELALIMAHGGKADSPIFGPGYEEDYSQYVPRGHYDRSSVLQKYFRAMMWFGRIGFRLQPGESDYARSMGRNETRQAILISLALKQAQSGPTTALTLWNQIYDPTAFFVGESDDLTVYDYLDVLNNTLGEISDLESLENDSNIQSFIDEALTRRSPLISSSFVMEYENHSIITKGFRFMGQRFIPDSYMFQELVHDKVSGRMFPKGLDVFSVFGSERAALHLADQESYFNYLSQVEKLRDEFANTTDSDWAQNLYWLWLYSLLPLLNAKGDGYPAFMQSEAWSDKELTTALGSWTELRHDTILYAKQSYTKELAAMENGGYIEPNPHLYGRLLSLAQMMKRGMLERGLLSSSISTRLNLLIETLQKFIEISKKELEGQKLISEDIFFISHIHETLKDIVSFPSETPYQSDADERIAVVADVHTDPNSGQVLEEGIGDVFAVYVLIQGSNGELFVARGGMFSYYEFTWPMNDRLTDESWQAILEAGSNSPPPSWTESFLLLDGSP